MIQAVEGLPDNIVGIVAKGRLTNDDWNRDIKPLIETSLKRHDKIRLYYEIGGRFPGAAWGNLRAWDRKRPAMGAGGRRDRRQLATRHDQRPAISDAG